jgi:transcriptional regulator with XRE-family HTH domain
MNIGNKIKALRFTYGNISEQELSEKIGIPEEKIKYWEKNLSRPNNVILEKLADFFKIEVDYFFSDEKKNKTSSSNIEIKKTDLKKTNDKTAIIKTSEPIVKKEKTKDWVPDKLKNFKEQLRTQKNESCKIIESKNSELCEELKKLNKKMDTLISVIQNKPQLTNIKEIQSVTNMEKANKLLKSGWVLLELFKNSDNCLGYRLGKTI